MSCLHRGPFIQRGRGFGSALSSMYKSFVPALQLFGKKILASPLTQQVLQTAKRSATQAGLNVATDVLQGKKVKDSLTENISTAKQAVTDSIVSALKQANSQTGVTEELKVEPKRSKRKASTILAAKKGGKKNRKRSKDVFDYI